MGVKTRCLDKRVFAGNTSGRKAGILSGNGNAYTKIEDQKENQRENERES
jgi:hypothetical protein